MDTFPFRHLLQSDTFDEMGMRPMRPTTFRERRQGASFCRDADTDDCPLSQYGHGEIMKMMGMTFLALQFGGVG